MRSLASRRRPISSEPGDVQDDGSVDVDVLPLTALVCERAARIRAASVFQLKVPDCLHLATAIEHGCDLFLTNGVALRRCTQITVEVL